MQGPPPTLRPDTCDVPSHLSTNLRSRGSLLWGNFDMLFCRDLGILSPIPGHKFQGAMWGKRKKDTNFSPCLHPQRDDVQKYHLLLQRQRQYKHLISNNLLGGSLFKLYSVWISWKSGVPHLLWKGSSEVHISPVFPEHDRSSSACASGVSCPGCQEGQAEEAVSETSLKEVISGLCFIGSIIYSVYLCSLPLLLLSELSQQHRYGLVNCSTWGFWAFAPERRGLSTSRETVFPRLQTSAWDHFPYGWCYWGHSESQCHPSVALRFLGPGAHCAPALSSVLGEIRNAGFLSHIHCTAWETALGFCHRLLLSVVTAATSSWGVTASLGRG